jgi:hypothetical protein
MTVRIDDRLIVYKNSGILPFAMRAGSGDIKIGDRVIISKDSLKNKIASRAGRPVLGSPTNISVDSEDNKIGTRAYPGHTADLYFIGRNIGNPFTSERDAVGVYDWRHIWGAGPGNLSNGYVSDIWQDRLVVGGVGGRVSYFNGKKWTDLSDFPVDVNAMAVVGDDLYCGGSRNIGRYDEATDSWINITPALDNLPIYWGIIGPVYQYKSFDMVWKLANAGGQLWAGIAYSDDMLGGITPFLYNGSSWGMTDYYFTNGSGDPCRTTAAHCAAMDVVDSKIRIYGISFGSNNNLMWEWNGAWQIKQLAYSVLKSSGGISYINPFESYPPLGSLVCYDWNGTTYIWGNAGASGVFTQIKYYDSTVWEDNNYTYYGSWITLSSTVGYVQQGRMPPLEYPEKDMLIMPNGYAIKSDNTIVDIAAINSSSRETRSVTRISFI